MSRKLSNLNSVLEYAYCGRGASAVADEDCRSLKFCVSICRKSSAEKVGWLERKVAYVPEDRKLTTRVFSGCLYVGKLDFCNSSNPLTQRCILHNSPYFHKFINPTIFGKFINFLY